MAQLNSVQWRRIAESELTVLITGPTGTGKSSLAKQLHAHSPRRDRIFATVNLATISENLLEGELFGYERGAFTGAYNRRIGRLEAADGGTVFLDEIGELSLPQQSRLLEFLQERTIVPVGANRERQLDVRILAATNRNLQQMVADGSFRADLFYRLNLCSLELQALQGRGQEIISSASAHLQKTLDRNISIDDEARAKLCEYEWPGNYRELCNVMEYAAMFITGDTLRVEHLPALNISDASVNHPTLPLNFQAAKAQFEAQFLQQALHAHGGRINATARGTGISKVTLIDKVRRYQIDIDQIRLTSLREKVGQCALK